MQPGAPSTCDRLPRTRGDRPHNHQRRKNHALVAPHTRIEKMEQSHDCSIFAFLYLIPDL